MITPPTRFIGTDKQIEWAQKIKLELQARYPGYDLPSTPYSQFWIENRNSTPDDLKHKASTDIRSPFTSTYPKTTRADVTPLLVNMHNWAVFDTETSGLPTGRKKIDNPEIVEMSIVAVASGEVLFNSLFKPHDTETYFNSEARQMHAHAEDDYLNAPTFADQWDTIKLIIEHFHLVAYNADFDFPMLRRTAHLWEIPTPRIKGTCAMKMFHAFMTTDVSDGKEFTKLSDACQIMGIDQERFGTAHTALADTLALRELLMVMTEKCLNGD